jgi:predicted 3-demethylubiquinone-9 3-methyltransferase (glyoxalase superfamily)
MNNITPYLWFNSQAEEAATLYTSIFKDSRIMEVHRYGEAGPGPKGTAMIVTFEIAGQPFMALNGGPRVKFTEAISFYVDCETQTEVDDLWEKLSEGGEKQPCGWLKDKYGVSWQIIPRALPKLMADPDPEKSRRVMEAMLQMGKIEIEGLEKAHRGPDSLG